MNYADFVEEKCTSQYWPNLIPDELRHVADGLVTEAGEFSDVLKKAHAYGKIVDYVNLREELGDILWYIQLFCNHFGGSIEELITLNMEKLEERYPGKWSQEKALNRDLDAERKVLEGGRLNSTATQIEGRPIYE